MISLQTFGIKNRLPRAWQSHAKGSGGHQTCHYRRQVLAIEANSIRGRLGHYRTGFRRPSQDRRRRRFRPASIKAIAQPKQNASPAKRKNPQAGEVIGWGSYPGQPITVRRAAPERRSKQTWPVTPASTTSGEKFKRSSDEARDTTLKAAFVFRENERFDNPTDFTALVELVHARA